MRVVDWEGEAIVFDLDGVLVDSHAAVSEAWAAWRARVGVPAKALDSETVAGRRLRDIIREIAPHLDQDAEAAFVLEQEQRLAAGVTEIAGARALLARIPNERWAIATSGSMASAQRRLAIAGIPVPAVFVTADDVRRGKPDPDPYLTACRQLGLRPQACLVFEDSPTGIVSAKSAGCTVVGVASWAVPRTLGTPDVVRDLRDVDVRATAPSLSIRIASVI